MTCRVARHRDRGVIRAALFTVAERRGAARPRPTRPVRSLGRLNKFDTDPHGFKEELVGKGDVSRFDIKQGSTGEFFVVSKNGQIVIPTGVVP